jgi:HlyD family secretion protein
MSSFLMRLGAVLGFATLLAGAIATAQDREAAEPAGRGAVDVFNSVEGRSIVITSRPDGARIEEGEVVCELDPSELQGRLAIQEIVVQGAEADAQGARIAREALVMGVVQYAEIRYRDELATITGEIKLAEANLTRAEDRLDWSRRMFEKGYVNLGEKLTNELTLQQARFNFELAQSRRKILIDFTKDKTIKSLKGEIETARGRELAKQAALERAKLAHKRLADRIRRCHVRAPAGGRIQYVARIGAGAVVRDGQVLCRIVADGRPAANVK